MKGIFRASRFRATLRLVSEPRCTSSTAMESVLASIIRSASLTLEAVSTRDYPIITGVFLVTGVVVMLVNLIVDLCYGYLDPKVRFDR